MPVIRFLQDRLRVPTIQLPLGQASDAAHLPNERLRILNLHRGIEVLQNLFILLKEELNNAHKEELNNAGKEELNSADQNAPNSAVKKELNSADFKA